MSSDSHAARRFVLGKKTEPGAAATNDNNPGGEVIPALSPDSVAPLLTSDSEPSVSFEPFPERRCYFWVPDSAPSWQQTDTAILISQRILTRVNQVVGVSLSEEIGGFLLGNRYRCPNTGRNYIIIDQEVAAQFTHATSVSLALTVEAWSQLHNDLGGRYRGKTLVGWYHSHPKMSVFLSSWDVDVHNLRFPRDWQTALVIEPEKQEGGFFIRRSGVLDVRNPVPFYEYIDSGDVESLGSVFAWRGYTCRDPRTGNEIEKRLIPRVQGIEPPPGGAQTQSPVSGPVFGTRSATSGRSEGKTAGFDGQPVLRQTLIVLLKKLGRIPMAAVVVVAILALISCALLAWEKGTWPFAKENPPVVSSLAKKNPPVVSSAAKGNPPVRKELGGQFRNTSIEVTESSAESGRVTLTLMCDSIADEPRPMVKLNGRYYAPTTHNGKFLTVTDRTISVKKLVDIQSQSLPIEIVDGKDTGRILAEGSYYIDAESSLYSPPRTESQGSGPKKNIRDNKEVGAKEGRRLGNEQGHPGSPQAAASQSAAAQKTQDRTKATVPAAKPNDQKQTNPNGAAPQSRATTSSTGSNQLTQGIQSTTQQNTHDQNKDRTTPNSEPPNTGGSDAPKPPSTPENNP
jgi:proteasome lid subunit RPN8/RPN11